MIINMKQRLKMLVSYAKLHGIAESQKDFGDKLGYATEQYTSKIFSGRERSYADFAQRCKKLIPNINIDWILTGAGSMLINSDSPPPMQTNIGDGVAVNNSNFRDINSTAALQKLADEIAEQRKMYAALLEKRDEELARKDEQIDKLLELLAAK